jgi:uncharacterized protein (DUF2141 family)
MSLRNSRAGRRVFQRSALVLLAFGALLVSTTTALGAGIAINRTPSPPQAVKVGSIQTVGYEVVYDTRGLRIVTTIENASGALVATLETRNLGDQDAVPGRRQTANLLWSVPANLATGKYRAVVKYFAVGDEDSSETGADATFVVAREIGDIQVVAFEDSNGNGVRDAGEPGLNDWKFDITSPLGGQFPLPTGPDGAATVPGVPVGAWRATETVKPGWTTTSPITGTVAVPVDGTGTFAVGQMRPGVISGAVFDDTNRNGTLQSGEPGLGGATLTLTGVDGKGNAITPISKPSDSDGTYSFTNLAPGTYTVTVTPLAGKVATNATVQSGIVIASNGTRDKVDFGLAASGNLSVTSFEDTNGNGVRDPGEPGIDCPFSLVGPNGAPDGLTTGATGTSARPDSVAGDWQVG